MFVAPVLYNFPQASNNIPYGVTPGIIFSTDESVKSKQNINASKPRTQYVYDWTVKYE